MEDFEALCTKAADEIGPMDMDAKLLDTMDNIVKDPINEIKNLING